MPPLPNGPSPVTDLAVEQDGSFAVLRFGYPSMRADGERLTDLEEILVYRATDFPAQAVSAAQAASHADRAPVAGERRRQTAARRREEAFFASARRIARLSPRVATDRARGAEVEYRDSLKDLLTTAVPRELAYAVVVVRHTGERSRLSNLARLPPAVPPGPPRDLLAAAEEMRICLSWRPPDVDVAGRPVEISGYHVYRRLLAEPEFGDPLNATPVAATDYADTSAAYGFTYVYTVTAVPKGHEKTEGEPAAGAAMAYRDRYSPPPVERLDALAEERLVRLVWTPVSAPDLAGYNVYRSTGKISARLNTAPVEESSYVDSTVVAGHSYLYRVRSVDRAGNESADSPPAPARPVVEP
jgi:hypothetical protein